MVVRDGLMMHGLETREPLRIRFPGVRTVALALTIGISCLVSACTSVPDTLSTTATAGDDGTKKYQDLEIVTNLPPPQNTNQGADELIAANDVLEVDVFQVDDLDRTTKVDAKGRISLPLIGMVDAAGRTIPELEAEIERMYATNYLQNPEVSVFVKDSAGQKITVDGAVRKPGIYAVSSTSTLLDVVAQAGGFIDVADSSKIYVFRKFGDNKLAANFNVEAIRAGKAQDPRIYGGDVVVSFTSDVKIAARNLREALGIATSAAVFAPL